MGTGQSRRSDLDMLARVRDHLVDIQGKLNEANSRIMRIQRQLSKLNKKIDEAILIDDKDQRILIMDNLKIERAEIDKKLELLSVKLFLM